MGLSVGREVGSCGSRGRRSSRWGQSGVRSWAPRVAVVTLQLSQLLHFCSQLLHFCSQLLPKMRDYSSAPLLLGAGVGQGVGGEVGVPVVGIAVGYVVGHAVGAAVVGAAVGYAVGCDVGCNVRKQ